MTDGEHYHKMVQEYKDALALNNKCLSEETIWRNFIIGKFGKDPIAKRDYIRKSDKRMDRIKARSQELDNIRKQLIEIGQFVGVKEDL